jgi:hypothetical protein
MKSRKPREAGASHSFSGVRKALGSDKPCSQCSNGNLEVPVYFLKARHGYAVKKRKKMDIA